MDMEWILCFVIPAVLLLFGALGKKLASPTVWPLDWSDLFLGLEFTLAAMAVCIINFGDLYRLQQRAVQAKDEAQTELARVQQEVLQGKDPKSLELVDINARVSERIRTQDKLLKEYWAETFQTVICLVLAFFMFFFVGFIHRHWEPKADDDLTPADLRRKRRWLILGGDGLGLIPTFAYFLTKLLHR